MNDYSPKQTGFISLGKSLILRMYVIFLLSLSVLITGQCNICYTCWPSNFFFLSRDFMFYSITRVSIVLCSLPLNIIIMRAFEFVGCNERFSYKPICTDIQLLNCPCRESDPTSLSNGLWLSYMKLF